LRSYDLSTGEKDVLLQPDWDVLGAGYARGGKYLIVWINENAALSSKIYDSASFQELKLKSMPKSLIRNMRISRDDSTVSFYSTEGSGDCRNPARYQQGWLGWAPFTLSLPCFVGPFYVI
jgi:hypothetical protein